MEVDMLVLCAGDQQQRSDENILATIDGELIVDETMSELATAESLTFDESRADDDEVCQCDLPVTSPYEESDSRSGGVARGTETTAPFENEPARSSDVCVLPASLSCTTRSDSAEILSAADDRGDCVVDSCRDNSVDDDDCECEPSSPADDTSNTASCVTEICNNTGNTETECDIRSLQGGQLETSSFSCTETTSTVSVIDTCAVIEQANVISGGVDSTLLVSVHGSESAGNVAGLCSSDALSTEQTSGLSGEVMRLELAEAIDIEAKKKAFRVRFHEECIVTGYLDPPTPWREVELCSTPELLAAYRESCKQMSVKPLNKLVQQLEAISNFEERHELLSLKGEAIDGRVCETLEEIFRRVRFRCIDLEATSLDEETAVTMFDLLDYYESCERLNISYNKNLGIRGWQACARFIKKTPCLEMLEARGCSFNDPAMTMIGRSLRLGSNVRMLHLENCFLSGRPLMLLVAAVKFNETLKELFVADNKLTPSDGVQLGSLLKTNHTLSLLDLRNNLLQDVGLAHICDGASEQGSRSGLNTLVMWNNQITYESMIALGRTLMVMKSLETINLGHNNITNEGIHRLKDGLLQNKSLLRIGLQSAKLSCEGAVALAEFIAETVRLIRLDLRGNYIRTGGLMALMLSLKVNQSVTRIDLDGEPKKEAGIRDYAEQQRRLLGDIATLSARNLAILAGLSPAQNIVSNSSSAVNNSVPATQHDSQPLEASSTTVSADEGSSTNASTSCQRPSLSLSQSLARSETLESPAYVPSDFGILPNDVCELQVSHAISSDKQLLIGTEAEAGSGTQTSSDAHQSHSPVASISIETETPAVTSLPSYEKLTPVQQPTAGKTSKFAASVRRKFTVVKAVVPSSSAPPVVVFSKCTAEAASPCEVENVDDGHVHIVDKVQSSDVTRSPVSDVNLPVSTDDTCPATETVTEVAATTTSISESTVITTDKLSADKTDTHEVSRLRQEVCECDAESVMSPEVDDVDCDENADDLLCDNHCDESTGKNVEMCSGLSVQQFEVDSILGSDAVSEHAAVKTGTLACDSEVNDGVDPPRKDAADFHEINSTVDKCGIVSEFPVNDAGFNCTASDCGNELNSIKCTTDELPFNNASDDILVAQVADYVAVCSTAEQMRASVSSSSSRHDVLQQNVECDNSEIAESVPSAVAAECSGPLQGQVDDTS